MGRQVRRGPHGAQEKPPLERERGHAVVVASRSARHPQSERRCSRMRAPALAMRLESTVGALFTYLITTHNHVARYYSKLKGSDSNQTVMHLNTGSDGPVSSVGQRHHSAHCSRDLSRPPYHQQPPKSLPMGGDRVYHLLRD